MNNELTPDFSEMVEFDDSPVPPGVYKVRVDSWEAKVGKDSGNPYINWKLVIFGADGDLAKQNNRVLFMMTMLKGKGTQGLAKFLTAALGEIPKSFATGWQDNLIGREFQVTAVKKIKPDGTEGWPELKNPTAIQH